jgi:hypothetical protein
MPSSVTRSGGEVSDDERYFHSALAWSPGRYHNSCVEDACARSVLAILHNFRDTAPARSEAIIACGPDGIAEALGMLGGGTLGHAACQLTAVELRASSVGDGGCR